MNTTTDDPRLTAYALGEMTDDERAAFEAETAGDAAVLTEIEAIRGAAARIAAALQTEPTAVLTAEQHRAVDAAAGRRRLRLRPAGLPATRRFALAAAAVALLSCGLLGAGVDVGPLLGWMEVVRTSSGHSSASRQSVDDYPRTTVFDLLRDRAVVPGAMGSLAGGADDGAFESRNQVARGDVAADAGYRATAEAPDLALPATALWQRLASTPVPPQTGGGSPADVAPVVDPQRKIIKDANLVIAVADVVEAVGRIEAIAAGQGGYVLSASTDDEDETGIDQAIVSFAVPVDRFETAVGQVRAMADRLVSDQTSGQDVTREYVDVQSEIANLEATRARIRQFLDRAATVDEALAVNAQLTQVEGQIAERRGRLEYLSQRAAYSTVTVTLEQAVTTTPTVTATPTPTATPLPPEAWSPVRPAREAYATLTVILQSLATFAIWAIIVGLPLWIPILLAAVAWDRYRRRQRVGA